MPRPRVVPLRAARPATVVALAGCVAAAVALSPSTSAIAQTTAHSTPRSGAPSAVVLAPGVTLRHKSFSVAGASERLTELTVDLATKGVSIDAASPGSAVGAQRQTVRGQTNARHALAGINADFFDLQNNAASPRGVLVTSGRMLKSPTTARNANLVLRRARNGQLVASVGALPFSGRIVRERRGTHNTGRGLTSVNSLVTARAGGTSLLTSRMAPSRLGRSCTLVTGRIVRGQWLVGRVQATASSTPQFTSLTWGLVSCGGSARTWLRSQLRPGDRVLVDTAISHGTPWAAVSGGSVLVRNGRAWSDPDGEHLPYNGRNAETFACVSRTGQQVTLGVIDGYTWQSAGVTYRQLSAYLLAQHCWSGLVLDGGGSTTLVAKLPGSSHATVQDTPAQDPARPVADTLVVFGRSAK